MSEGLSSNVADRSTCQIQASGPDCCMACTVLSVLARCGIPDLTGAQNEKHMYWELGIIDDCGISMEDALSTLRHFLGDKWSAIITSEDPVVMAQPGAISIAAIVNPGSYKGHVVATYGNGVGVIINDSRDDKPTFMPLADMPAAFKTERIAIFPVGV